MKKYILLGIVASPIALLCASWIHNKVIGPTGWAKDDAEKALRVLMKDPDSTVIRSYFVTQRRDNSGATDIYLCGIVDAKNSFGAFTGGTLFTSHSAYDEKYRTFETYSTNIEDPVDSDTAHKLGMLSAFEKVYWNDFCVDSLHPPLLAPKATDTK
jgi:hypothetical protein